MAYVAVIVTVAEMQFMAGEQVDATGDVEDNHIMLQDQAEGYLSALLQDDVADKFFGDMTNETQLWIWKRENRYTEEDMQGKIDNIGDMECHRRREEGDDIE